MTLARLGVQSEELSTQGVHDTPEVYVGYP